MTPSRRPLIAGNWKMYDGGLAGIELAMKVRELARELRHVALLVAPPFTAIAAIAHELDGSGVAVAGQNMHDKPQGAFTAGCMFKNFEYTDESALEKLRREGDEIPSEMLVKKRIAAGWLIDKLGLKGKTIGRAQVSPVHGNFLVNLGGATAQDVIALSSYVKMKVRDELGILLEDEVQYLI